MFIFLRSLGRWSDLVKGRGYEIGHVSTHADGTRWKKVAPNKWVPDNDKSQKIADIVVKTLNEIKLPGPYTFEGGITGDDLAERVGHSKGAHLFVEGVILGPDSARKGPAGMIQRQFYTAKDGSLGVHHSWFVLDEKHHKKGIAKALTAQSLEMYEKLGITEITTSPTDDGRVVWAKFGFSWGNSDPAAIEEHVIPTVKNWLVRSGLSEKKAQRLAEKNTTPAQIATLEVHGSPVGKNLLKNDDADLWYKMRGEKSHATMKIPSPEHKKLKEYLQSRSSVSKSKSSDEGSDARSKEVLRELFKHNAATDLMDDADEFAPNKEVGDPEKSLARWANTISKG